MIAEFASCEPGGNKGAWIRDAYLNRIPNYYTRLKVVVWFNRNLECDWRVNSSSGALGAYRESVNNAYYSGQLY